MGVLIKGMKMPKACIDCDTYIAHDYCTHFAQFATLLRKDGRYDDCPLVKIDLVTCGECKYMSVHYDTDGNLPFLVCLEWDSGTDIDGYCYLGERRE